jgi:hypothetical protein
MLLFYIWLRDLRQDPRRGVASGSDINPGSCFLRGTVWFCPEQEADWRWGLRAGAHLPCSGRCRACEKQERWASLPPGWGSPYAVILSISTMRDRDRKVMLVEGCGGHWHQNVRAKSAWRERGMPRLGSWHNQMPGAWVPAASVSLWQWKMGWKVSLIV